MKTVWNFLKYKSNDHQSKVADSTTLFDETESDKSDMKDNTNRLVESSENDLSYISEEDHSNKSQTDTGMSQSLGVSVKPTNDINIKLNENDREINDSKFEDNSKSEQSTSNLFESKDKISEDNETFKNFNSRDQKGFRVTTTSETAKETTTEPTISHPDFEKIKAKYTTKIVTLKKSSNGFGFSLTSRQNPVDLTNPVYVSKVLANGSAILDGRMKAGDRIVMINDQDVSKLSQREIKTILLSIPFESTVNFGLYRRDSDAISKFLDSLYTSSKCLEKNSKQKMVNHTTVRQLDEDFNKISVKEEKPVSFPMCYCVHNNLYLSSKLNLYHFEIPLEPDKPEKLSPVNLDRISKDNNFKSITTKSQNSENNTEPSPTQISFQNKSSPGSFYKKYQTSNKASNATLGIGVIKGISQMTFTNSHIEYQNSCNSESKFQNSELKGSFSSNNNTGNIDESRQKFCSNCRGLLSYKNGVFVKSIIPGGLAYLDGRLLIGDEIIAVDGVYLYNAGGFSPNKTVVLGDRYDSQKFAHLQDLNPIIDLVNYDIDSSNGIDPLIVLRQILSSAQLIFSSVSLIILRRNHKQKSRSINRMTSFERDYSHNLTVVANDHKDRDLKQEGLPDTLNSSTIFVNEHSKDSFHHKPKIKRLGKYVNKHYAQGYNPIGDDDNDDGDDNSFKNPKSGLICHQSDHKAEDIATPTTPENIPTAHHTNEGVFLEDSSSGLLSNIEKTQKLFEKNDHVDLTKDSVDEKVSLRHSKINRQPSYSASDLHLDPVSNHYTCTEFDHSYFGRDNVIRQSFHHKRKYKNNKKTLSNNFNLHKNGDQKILSNTMTRPTSLTTLYQVPEEDTSDCFSPTPSSLNQHEYYTQTIDRKITLRRRSAMTKF